MNTEQQKLGTTQLQSDQRSAFFCCGNAQTLECPSANQNGRLRV